MYIIVPSVDIYRTSSHHSGIIDTTQTRLYMDCKLGGFPCTALKRKVIWMQWWPSRNLNHQEV